MAAARHDSPVGLRDNGFFCAKPFEVTINSCQTALDLDVCYQKARKPVRRRAAGEECPWLAIVGHGT